MGAILQHDRIHTFLESLYESYRQPLLRIIHKYVGTSDVSEDLFQEVFVRIISYADLLITLPKPKLEAYIILIARGVSVDYLRKNHIIDRVDIGDETLFDIWEGSSALNEDALGPINKADLMLMMHALSPEDRVLLIGKYYLGLSTDELVKIVGGTVTAIRSRIHRARNKIMDEWKRSGLNIGDFIDG